jgi:hypothetical protein
MPLSIYENIKKINLNFYIAKKFFYIKEKNVLFILLLFFWKH